MILSREVTRRHWEDRRYINDANGSAVTVWRYWPGSNGRINFSGTGPGTVGLFTEAIEEHGHAITEAPGSRPWNHHVAGVGVGHDDARFAESGESMAAYYESGEAYGGAWWDADAWHRKYYGPARVAACRRCGSGLEQKTGAIWTDAAGRMTCDHTSTETALDSDANHVPDYPPAG